MQCARCASPRDLFPWRGLHRAWRALAALCKKEGPGMIETADRGLMLASQVWRHGVAIGGASGDIADDPKNSVQHDVTVADATQSRLTPPTF